MRYRASRGSGLSLGGSGGVGLSLDSSGGIGLSMSGSGGIAVRLGSGSRVGLAGAGDLSDDCGSCVCMHLVGLVYTKEVDETTTTKKQQ